jgi:hypothetical protein
MPKDHCTRKAALLCAYSLVSNREGCGCHAWIAGEEMFIDPATLQDLEVVSTPTVRGPTLWALIDRTRSRAGREHLRQRLFFPSHSSSEIAQIQRAHQSLAADADAYCKILHRADCDLVEAYLKSNWQLPNAMGGLDMLAGSLFTRDKWFPHYMKDVSKGQASVLALMDAAAELRSHLVAADSSVLQAIADRIEFLIHKQEAEQLRRSAGSSRIAKLAFDQLAREGEGAARRCHRLCRRSGSDVEPGGSDD